MKNLEWSDVTSNLLIVSSVSLALTPLLLGDQLIVIVSSFMKEVSVMSNQFSVYLASFF